MSNISAKYDYKGLSQGGFVSKNKRLVFMSNVTSIAAPLLVFATLLLSTNLALAVADNLPARGGSQQPSAPASSNASNPSSNTQSPQSQTTPAQNSSGSTSAQSATNSGPIEAQILAYESLSSAADGISTFLVNAAQTHTPGAGNTAFIMLDASQQSFIQAYAAFEVQAKLLRAQFCTALKLPVKTPKGPTLSSFSAATTAVSGAAAAITATLAIFKETRTITPNAITVPDEALVAAVVDKLLTKSVQVFYPAELPLPYLVTDSDQLPSDVDTVCSDDHDATVYKQLASLQYLRAQSEVRLALINGEKAPDRVQETIDVLTAINKIYDSTAASWSTVNPSTSNTGWAAILRGAAINRLTTGKAYILELKVQSSGGEVVSLDGLLFLTGASYFYSGGTIVTAILYDAKTSQIVAARNFWQMKGDQKRQSFGVRKNP